ncbi:MAG: hypothetical protein K5760_05515 [Clostridium sp.]|nr:hypothetical protein [Clostridium sp.]
MTRIQSSFKNRRVIKAGTAIDIQRFIPPDEYKEKHEETPNPAISGSLSVKKFSPEDASGFSGSDEPANPCPMMTATQGQISNDLEMIRAKMIREAMEKCDKLLQQADREAKDIRKEAFNRGYNDGYRQGMQDGEESAVQLAESQFAQKLQSLQEEVANAVEEIRKNRKKAFHRYLDELRDIALTVAEKVVRISLESSGEVIKKMILSEAEELKHSEWIKIYIDRYDYNRLLEVDHDVADDLQRISDNIKFVVLNKEDTGYCVIETPNEMIDIGVKTQLENIRDELAGVPYDEDGDNDANDFSNSQFE